MKLIIASTYIDSVAKFVAAVGGPKISNFNDLSYGDSVQTLAISFDEQNPQKTLKNYTKYFAENNFWVAQIVIDQDELPTTQQEANIYIISRITSCLEKSGKKLKKLDFKLDMFLSDLNHYLSRKASAEIQVKIHSS